MAMPNKYAEVTPRNFNPMWAPGLSDEAREELVFKVMEDAVPPVPEPDQNHLPRRRPTPLPT
jgi:hypothetical protein